MILTINISLTIHKAHAWIGGGPNPVLFEKTIRLELTPEVLECLLSGYVPVDKWNKRRHLVRMVRYFRGQNTVLARGSMLSATRKYVDHLCQTGWNVHRENLAKYAQSGFPWSDEQDEKWEASLKRQ